MTDRTFDPNQMLAAAREALERLEAFLLRLEHRRERLARLQYAVAGDVMESGIARMHAAFAATSPSELFSKHTELNSQFVDKLRARAEEFATVTSEIQAKINQFGTEIAAKAVHARKAA